jgi:S-adenosylmethionine hydrolase
MLTLASDFGSPYPAAMKGVLLSRTDARLVDVAHDLPRQDVRAGAFWLREVLPWFPPAVHLAVVDPGVGTDRRALAVRAGEHALVGPDNGLLRPAARALVGGRDGDASDADGGDGVEVFEIAVDDPASATFHGRDVFAPAAGDVHRVGVGAMADLDALSPLDADAAVDLTLPTADVDGDVAVGEALVVDGFGNVVTNVPGEFLAGATAATVGGERTPVGRSFAAVDPGERLLTVGSHGYVECDVNRGRGDDAFGLAPGDPVRIERSDG